MKKEEWVDIKNYEGVYQISNTGKIRSRNFNKIKIIKGRIGKDGYVRVNLYKNKTSKTFKVHRLVSEAYIENTYSKAFVNHKNLIKTDNDVDNLEWATPLENTRHYIYNENKKRKKQYENISYERRKFSILDLNEMYKMNCNGFSLSQIANHYNVATTSVIQILLSYIHPDY